MHIKVLLHSWEEGLCIRRDSLQSSRTYRTFQATPPELFTALPNKRQSGVTAPPSHPSHFALLFLFLIQPRSLLLSPRFPLSSVPGSHINSRLHRHHTKTQCNSATFTATNKESEESGRKEMTDARLLKAAHHILVHFISWCLLRPRSISSKSLSLLCEINRQW